MESPSSTGVPVLRVCGQKVKVLGLRFFIQKKKLANCIFVYDCHDSSIGGFIISRWSPGAAHPTILPWTWTLLLGLAVGLAPRLHRDIMNPLILLVRPTMSNQRLSYTFFSVGLLLDTGEADRPLWYLSRVRASFYSSIRLASANRLYGFMYMYGFISRLPEINLTRRMIYMLAQCMYVRYFNIIVIRNHLNTLTAPVLCLICLPFLALRFSQAHVVFIRLWFYVFLS